MNYHRTSPIWLLLPLALMSQFGAATERDDAEHRPDATYLSVSHADPVKCAEVRASLVTLETRPRLRFTDASGQVRFMTDAERAEEIDKAHSAIEVYCED